MNHRLQASGFFSHPFSANPSCGGEGLMEKRSSDPGEILSQPSLNPSPCTSLCCQSQPEASGPSHSASTISTLQCNIPSQDTPESFPNQWTCPIPVCIPGLVHPPHLDSPAGNLLLCCKDLLQMLMLSLRWRALRLICQNTFHTLLLKLCPLLFPAFKLQHSPVCQRHAGSAASRPCRAAGAAERGVKRCPSERLLPAGSWAERGQQGSARTHPAASSS